MTHRLFVVRHGNTFEAGEAPRRIGARSDVAMTVAGAAQIDRLAAWFDEAGVVFDAVLCGPLRRARATAERLCAAQPLPRVPRVARFLDEIDHGPDEGRADADVIARIGVEALRRWDGDGRCPDGWTDARARRLTAWRALARRVAGRPGATALVTSNGAARFGPMAYGVDHVLRLRTGAFGEIGVASDGVATVVRWDVRPDDPAPLLSAGS